MLILTPNIGDVVSVKSPLAFSGVNPILLISLTLCLRAL